ncbi:MAG TPA: MFS transporter [Aquella sp.]|nr:MFS transporter [Aquella sp.]
MTTGISKPTNLGFTIFLLYCGYFVDFYDLTIFSTCYNRVIQDLFQIHNTIEIQSLFLTITNVFTAGIVIGAITFGVLGDKFGRSYVIRYSMLVYSIAIILSVFAKSIILFTILRFITGFGLATGFATSSILLAELLSPRQAAISTKWLYFSGILGGMTAVFINKQFSWQLVFLCGGFGGVLIFMLRKNILESLVFKSLMPTINRGNFFKLFANKAQIIKLIKLFILTVPFNFVISVMFILPNFMPISLKLGSAIQILLTGFFLGNLISTFATSYIINYFRDYRVYCWLNIILFILVLPLFRFISNDFFFIYCLFIGLLGGGIPTVCVQIINKSYPTEIRNTASNTLFAMGRSSSIVFNLLCQIWIINKNLFIYSITTCVFVIASLVIIALLNTKNNYAYELNQIRS